METFYIINRIRLLIYYLMKKVASLPQEEEIYQATAVDAFVSEANKSLIAVISKMDC